MINITEKDLRRLLIDDEARRWHDMKIAPKSGWLYDWDGDAWAFENYRNFLKYLIAFDLEARNEYLKKRAQNDVADEPNANFDEAFLRETLAASRKRGRKDAAKKAAALYFPDDNLRNWFQRVWLSDDENWVYDPERDDAFLAEILYRDDLRTKAPDVVQKLCRAWCLPFVGSLTYRIARKKYGYHPEEFFRDVYQRLFGRDGRRKNAKNAIDFWRKETPTNNLREWVELETLRELERALKQRQRAFWAATFLSAGDLNFVETAAKKDGNSTQIDAQTIFDRFYEESPSAASLLAAYWSSNVTFEELAWFWNVDAQEKKTVDGKTLNKRFERALDRFREVFERSLNVEIPKDRWGKIVKIFLKSAAPSNETKEESERTSRLRETGKNGRRIRARFVTEPTENDKELLLRVLEAKRVDETGCVIRLLRQKFQGGSFDTNVTIPAFACARRVGGSPAKKGGQENNSLDDFRRSDAAEEGAQSVLFQHLQRPALICGSPVGSFDADSVRNYWRNKYSENNAVVLYFESATAAPGSAEYWRAEARIPLFAASGAEVPIFFGGYNPLDAAPCSLTLGEKTTPVLHGVAIVALRDFRSFVENGELPRVTVLQRRVDDGKRARWHVKIDSKTRLLLQKPIVPDKER